ncbi:MAG TPA: hypothetical protein RMF84_20300 [Polyangiaceae bacterium LLY-WYZ-14_1]|nr:hypothetical protein [Polyangiaceae bacterium LLY-WYZ-14_1]
MRPRRAPRAGRGRFAVGLLFAALAIGAPAGAPTSGVSGARAQDASSAAAGRPPPPPAGTLEALFRQAAELAARGEHGEALVRFDRLVELGVQDPDVYFDRGTVHARQESYGRAIRDYRATLALRPGDADARQGIRSALEALARRRAEAEGEATVPAADPPFAGLAGFLDEAAAAWTVLVLDLAFFLALGAWILARGELRRVVGAVTTMILGALLALGLLVLGMRRGAFTAGEPAVVLDDAPLLEGPVEGAVDRGTLAEGLRVTVVDERAGHRRVRTGDRRGWVRAEAIGIVGE